MSKHFKSIVNKYKKAKSFLVFLYLLFFDIIIGFLLFIIFKIFIYSKLQEIPW